MMTIREGKHRPHTNAGWLDSHHAFSFGDWRVRFEGSREQRAITSASGFPALPHRKGEVRIESVKNTAPAAALVFEVGRGESIPCT